MADRSFAAAFLVPMAVSLAFGVLFATFITLILVPTAYMVLEDVRCTGRQFLGWGNSAAERTAEAGRSAGDPDATLAAPTA